MKNFQYIFVSVLVLVFFSACQKTLEIYIGLPLQPKNINAIYEPGLNVFGILKAGETLDTINHYFEVQTVPEIFDTTSNLNIFDAQITLTQNRDALNSYNLFHIGEGRYFHYGIDPKPGDIWEYHCVYDTFDITSTSIVPNMPFIIPESLKQRSSNISFLIKYDSTAFMYDVYYVDQFSYALQRIVPEAERDNNVSLDINTSKKSEFNLLYVIAYDKNYEEYVTTSNIFFKPNAYRPRFTTVNNGFGCFGSLTSLKLDLNE